MIHKIDCFLAQGGSDDDALKATLHANNTVHHIHACKADNSLMATADVKAMAEQADTDYVLLYTKTTPLTMGQGMLERMLRVAKDAGAAMVYSDYYTMEQGERKKHPVIDHQLGAIRNDFDYGSATLIDTRLLKEYAQETTADYRFAALYDLRLFLSRKGSIFHINEYLYTEEETDLRKSGEKQFDYVNPANREVQIEMEKAATHHLSEIGARINTSEYETPNFSEQDFETEASVVIPVRNREKTILDAVNSALKQTTKFRYNVIVVDNHSTDDTTRLLRSIDDERLVHIIPERTDLGIGGCWNVAVNDEHCGRFAVQLDSDDLYSSENTLQAIVNAFYEQKAAMVIGSYRMCDFDLNTLPPGIIDHREWTDENGANNALRINGLGAPRAFFTPMLRQIQFPNTSYGEDYALGLIFSRRYRIGRIYDELYLCRRWGGNSDAALSVEQVNANNLYKDRLRTLEILARQQMMKGEGKSMSDNSLTRFFNRQLQMWEDARVRYRELQAIETKELEAETLTMIAQHNPARMVSTGASIKKSDITSRPCFLCEKNRPAEQAQKVLDSRFELLVNPYPILPVHYTIPSLAHTPQQILGNYDEMHKILDEYPDLMVFYNGPKCGASAPDHAHFQAGTSGIVPLQKSWQRLCRNLTAVVERENGEGIWTIADYPCTAFLIKSISAEGDIALFESLYKALPLQPDDTEPMMNIVAWRSGEEQLTVVLPRKKHRPDCYYAEGVEQMIISPGALDMAGLFIVPRREDYNKITAEKACDILREVALDEKDMANVVEKLKASFAEKEADNDIAAAHEEPQVTVGIVSAQKIAFTLNSHYTAKGADITGEQEVEFSEGGILWQGNLYSTLTFRPQDDDASFCLHDVTIGVNFHWERKERQTFLGTLRLVVEADKIVAINELPVEQYLESVISSEMAATSSLELLKAHAVISRSWLLAQMEKRKRLQEGETNGFFSFIKKDDEIIRWYDREDHTLFDVCADDHCQRYQGITKAGNPAVKKAIAATRGQILMGDGEICDARFSKCCGGVSEEFQYCWEDTPKSYLAAVRDAAPTGKGIKPSTMPDLTVEQEAERWIMSKPESFCNTRDAATLRQVLNDYDRETANFYRWQVEYSQDEISALLTEKTGTDFGAITDLVPLERGKSGRICRLKIVGTQKTLIIGKELEIRRVLSNTHLYSSAFVVKKENTDADGIPQRFTLFGAGWGHGVGLCQIGAAVMGEKGYGYDDILLHYYTNAEIKRVY
ncbi:MAG: DUF4922 domain-containing protein [Prevotella sp.]|nr:DUF4922 domain-containing protein [Prevotella sp.]